MKIGLLGFGGNGILAAGGVVNNTAVFLLKSPHFKLWLLLLVPLKQSVKQRDSALITVRSPNDRLMF